MQVVPKRIPIAVGVGGIDEVCDRVGMPSVGQRLLPIGFQLQCEGVVLMMWVMALVCLVSFLKKKARRRGRLRRGE